MFLSIVIPTLNRSTLLKASIESILSQHLDDLEIIIVDDGGTDNTAEMIEIFSDSRLRYFKIINSERGAARNFGLSQAKGNYVNFFDSDDLFLPCLGSLREFTQNNCEPDVLYGDFQQIDGRGNILAKEAKPYQEFTKNLLHNNFLACGAVFLRRAIALRFPFVEDRRLSSAEDWELWVRIHAHYEFRFFPEPVFQQVEHDSRSLTTIDPERVELRDNYFVFLVLNNVALRKHYGGDAIALFIADRYSFIALSFSKQNFTKTLYYWKKSLLSSLEVVKRKRFWAVLKKMLFG